MPRISPLSLTRPAPPAAITRDFDDPNSPEPITITLRPLQTDERFLINDFGAEAVLKYLGDPENKVAPKMAFPSVGGQFITLSESLLLQATLLTFAQGESEYPKYNLEEMVALAVTCPTAFSAISIWMNELQREYNALCATNPNLGKDSAAVTVP